MRVARFRQIDALFARILELPEGDRQRALHDGCGGDPELRAAVVELLAADQSANDLLDRPLLPREPHPLGSQIGPYRLERRIGHGGMGAVYLAQREDVDRPVALKLIESPWRHPDLVPRFHAERQILARLDHPAIARLYDAGETDQGTPYLVLEYVDGEPLDVHCDRHGLSLTARLALFQQLLDAVAHAHQSLLVHRDIKPGNVLVTAPGQIKLLDFGIAKRLATPSSAASLTRGRPMTPAYASPEQVRGEPVTTATDIYSLGVVLYELLTGRSPYRLTSKLPHELEAAILEQEPLRASFAFEGGEAVWIAEHRGSTPRECRRTLQGDLDTIVATALHKEPDRRYRSVLELGADLDRWRGLLPIAARPDSRAYRWHKFLRRQRVGVAVGLGVLALVSGLLVSLVHQRNRATRELDRAQETLRFVVGVFQEDTDYLARTRKVTNREVTAREVLAAAAQRAEDELIEFPDLQASLFRAVGQATSGIGRHDEAAPLLERALSYEQRNHPDSPTLAASLEAAGGLDLLRDQVASAQARLEEAVALRRRLDPGSLALATALQSLGSILIERDRDSEAPDLDRIESLFSESLAISRRLEGPNGANTIASLAGMVSAAGRRRDLAPAKRLAREVLAATTARYGPDHPRAAGSRRSLAMILLDLAEFDEAEPLCRQALAAVEKALPPDHPEVGAAASDLGLVLTNSGRAVESEPYFRRAYQINLAQFGPTHRDTLSSLSLLATALQNQGRNAEVVPLRELGLAGEIQLFGEASQTVSVSMSALARALASTGQFVRAEQLARRGLEIRETLLPTGHPDLGTSHRHLGMVLLLAGKAADAEPHLRTAYDEMERLRGAEFFQTAAVEVALASCLTQLGRFDEAAACLTHGQAVLEAQFSADHPLVTDARTKAAALAAARSKG